VSSVEFDLDRAQDPDPFSVVVAGGLMVVWLVCCQMKLKSRSQVVLIKFASTLHMCNNAQAALSVYRNACGLLSNLKLRGYELLAQRLSLRGKITLYTPADQLIG